MAARRTTETRVCGWCAGAPVSAEPHRAHRRCYSTEENPCQCAADGHEPSTAVAKVQALYCHMTLQEVNACIPAKSWDPSTRRI